MSVAFFVAAAMIAGACSSSEGASGQAEAVESSDDGTVSTGEAIGQDSAGDSTAEDEAREESAGGAKGSGDDGLPSAAAAGRGTLVDVSTEYGIDEALLGIRGHAVATADVNDDGWADLFVGTFADRPPETYQERGASGPAPDRLLLGGPDGFLVDESFDPPFGRAAGARFADLDNDGDPDLIVSRNPRESERAAAPSEVYRNDDGVLSPVTVLDEFLGGRAVDTLDYDGDGLLDIVLVEDRWSSASTQVFHNEGDFEFRAVGNDVGIPDGVFGLGLGIGDLDGDGALDLVIGGSNRIFLGDGAGFREAAASPLPWELKGDEDDPAHVALADVDGDGDLDILIGQHFNSTIDFGEPEPIRLFANQGVGADGEPRFEDVTDAAGLPLLDTKSPQILVVDLDGDGMDEIVTTATYEDAATGIRTPLVLSPSSSGTATFDAPAVKVGPHYWIDAVTLDANQDGRPDLFFVEWEPSLGSRLFLNLPVDN